MAKTRTCDRKSQHKAGDASGGIQGNSRRPKFTKGVHEEFSKTPIDQ